MSFVVVCRHLLEDIGLVCFLRFKFKQFFAV